MRSVSDFPSAFRTTLLAIVITLSAGCARITPVDYVPIDEIPPGPGLLSGEDGAFTLSR